MCDEEPTKTKTKLACESGNIQRALYVKKHTAYMKAVFSFLLEA